MEFISYKDDIGVHATHCCIIHGCKYGEYDTCPVCLAEVKQERLCEFCYDFVYEELKMKSCYDFVYEELKMKSELQSEIDQEFLKRSRLYKLNKISKNNDDRGSN